MQMSLQPSLQKCMSTPPPGRFLIRDRRDGRPVFRLRLAVGCRVCVTALALASLPTGARAAERMGPPIPKSVLSRLVAVETDFYKVYSDLDELRVRDMSTRLDAFTRDLDARYDFLARSRKKKKMPVFLIQDPVTYKTLGGQAYGVTWGDRIVVLYSAAQRDEFWHTIQHEAWHLFAHSLIAGPQGLLPGWLDEGLAEYHGESLWTGDGFTCGVFPQNRRVRSLQRIREGRGKDFAEFVTVKAEAWSGIENYDQGLAMMHFFLESGNTNYVHAVHVALERASKGRPFDKIFEKGFGRQATDLQKEFADWWSAQTEATLDRVYTEATVATLTSFLARAHGQGQRFATADEFLKAAREGTLKNPPAFALPNELLKEALDRAAKRKTWTLETDPKNRKLPQKLVLKMEDEPVFFTGMFSLDLKGRPSVRVLVTRQ